MPRIFPAPADPGVDAFMAYISRLQADRRRREEERAAEREAQKKRLVTIPTTIVGAVLGGVGAAAGAGVGVASSAATGAAVTASGAAAGATLGGIATGALTGGAIGARIGEQFVGGDIAGGLTTAASAAQGLMRAQTDRQLYGGTVTPRDRTFLAQAALKAGTNLPQLEGMARQSGQLVPDLLNTMSMEQETRGQFGDRLKAFDFPGTVEDAEALIEQGTFPDRSTLLQTLQGRQDQRAQQQAGQQAYARISGQRDAEARAAVQREQMEYRFDPRGLAQRSADLKAIDESVGNGDLTVEQGAQMKAAMPRLVPTAVPRRTPKTIEEDEQISNKTGYVYVPDTRGGRRYVGNIRGEEDVAETILKHQQAMTKATFTRVSVAEAAADYVKAQGIADQITAGTFQAGKPGAAGAAVPGQVPGAPGAAPPQAAQNVQLQQRVQTAVQRLTEVQRFFPDDPAKWVPQMTERFIDDARLISKVLIDKMERGGTLTPEEVKLARFVRDLIQRS